MSNREDDIAALRRWLQGHDGFLHQSVEISSHAEHGLHLRAAADIARATKIIAVPLHLTLSCLNAMVDDAHPVFRDFAGEFTVEALGFFYLATQYINIDVSFWRPYLRCLPAPESLNTPFWFEDADIQWLKGSDVHRAFLEREKVWLRYWEDGLKVLARAGVDTEPYTWPLFKWAATMFSSRSFGSRALHNQSTSQWHTFKHSDDGSVKVEIAALQPERQNFSVLFPVMDSMNHSPEAKVDWNFAPSQFTLDTCELIRAGSHVYNNYGPKSNTELLMGYGFCIPDNPYDCVMQTLRPPPPGLTPWLLAHHSEFFDDDGRWRADAATFQLYPPTDPDLEDPLRCWTSMPQDLLRQLYYRIRTERGLEVVEPIRDPGHYLLNREGSRYLPRMAFLIAEMFLAPKITRLVVANRDLPSETTNARQEMANVYRTGQLRIMRAIHESHLQFLRSLRPPQDFANTNYDRPLLWTLPELLRAGRLDSPDHFQGFAAGIRASFDIPDQADRIADLAADDERDILILWVCYAYLYYQPWMASYKSYTETPNPLLAKYLHNLECEYGEPVADGGRSRQGSVDSATTPTAIDPQAGRWLTMVQRATASAVPDSIWHSKAWTSDFVLDWGLRIVESQGMSIALDPDSQQQVFLYLHTDEDDFPV